MLILIIGICLEMKVHAQPPNGRVWNTDGKTIVGATVNFRWYYYQPGNYTTRDSSDGKTVTDSLGFFSCSCSCPYDYHNSCKAITTKSGYLPDTATTGDPWYFNVTLTYDKTSSVSKSQMMASDFGMHISPNPLNGSTTISLYSHSNKFAQVSICNLLGSEVARLFTGSLDAGEHSFTWEAHGMQTGMYIVVVKVNSNFMTLPLLVIK